MAQSNVALANMALQKLGAGVISSLSQDHPNARSVNRVFDSTRDAEIRRYDWAFAITRASVAADAAQTLWGGHNKYALPADFARLLLDDESDTIVDWRIEGRFIITDDAAPLEFRYLARVDDPTLFDPLFDEAFACKLAIECCQSITQSTSKKQDLKDDYKFAINEAKRLGSIERAEKDPPEDEWLEVRR
jgi:hypothetical protein